MVYFFPGTDLAALQHSGSNHIEGQYMAMVLTDRLSSDYRIIN